MRIVFIILTAIVCIYSFSYSLYLWKAKNRLQAMVVITLIVLSFVSGLTDTFFTS
ncbi:MAG: hypothetical protein IKV88_06310 [Clostridia bacterium]|nr:hypothetical protein [Clostridia bacterium]